MTEEGREPTTFPLAELEARCRHEPRRYRRSEPSDSRFCLEIFRRALALTGRTPADRALGSAPATEDESRSATYADEEARTTLVRIYSEFIKAHINPAALRNTPLEDLVQQVWLRFWRAANNGLYFPSLEAALRYLERATLSTLIE